MTLDKAQAAQALADIDQSQRYSSSLYSYSRASPYLIVAGVMWLVADLLTEFSPFDKAWIWPVVSLIGTVCFFGLSIAQTRPGSRSGSRPVALAKRGMFWRFTVVWLAIFAFMIATFAIYGLDDGRQQHSFIGVFCGCLYVAVGVFMGWRMVAVGAALAVLSMVGFFAVHEYYLAYMGVIGGGALILSGLWLRAA
jgi:hypothetical protein